MPFTMNGEWIPAEKPESKPKKPVKVRLAKRGKNILTLVLNLNLSLDEITELSSKIKKKLGCGGCVKNQEIEIQGDKVEQVQKILQELNIKSS